MRENLILNYISVSATTIVTLPRRCNAATPQRRDDATPQRRNDATYTCEMSVTSVVTELHPKGLLRVVQISIYAYVEICHRTQHPQKRPGPIKIHQKSG